MFPSRGIRSSCILEELGCLDPLRKGPAPERGRSFSVRGKGWGSYSRWLPGQGTAQLVAPALVGGQRASPATLCSLWEGVEQLPFLMQHLLFFSSLPNTKETRCPQSIGWPPKALLSPPSLSLTIRVFLTTDRSEGKKHP